jgi:hypothetical protein
MITAIGIKVTNKKVKTNFLVKDINYKERINHAGGHVRSVPPDNQGSSKIARTVLSKALAV